MCRQPLSQLLSPSSAKLMIMASEEYGYQSRRGIRVPKKWSLRTQDELRLWDIGDNSELCLLKCPLCSMVADSICIIMDPFEGFMADIEGVWSPRWKCQLRVCMRTRSKARRLRQQQQQQVPPNLVEPPKDTMADNRTMAELLQAPTEGYEDAIVVPEIEAANFEIKHGVANSCPEQAVLRT
ncbi:hypothetical protein Tco_0558030 [Tanacetum coccineum]